MGSLVGKDVGSGFGRINANIADHIIGAVDLYSDGIAIDDGFDDANLSFCVGWKALAVNDCLESNGWCLGLGRRRC